MKNKHINKFTRMSLCYRVKRFWVLYWEGVRKGDKKKDSAIVKAGYHEVRNKGPGKDNGFDEIDTDLISSGVPFNSNNEELEGFNSKMDEMWRIHKGELRQIRAQHDRLKAGRILLNRRVSELERMLQADQRTSATTAASITGNDDPSLTSEDLELISEMEGVLQMLEKTQEELNKLEKHLEIELRERMLYPEPVILRTRTLEDEFSKQMRLDGGLKYECNDKKIRRITHRCLPPPLSLSELLESTAMISQAQN